MASAPPPPLVDPKTPKVDKESFQKREDAITKEIDELKREQGELAKKIEERSSGKDDFTSKTKVIRAEMDGYQRAIEALASQKNKIKETLDAKKNEAQQQYGEFNKMKKSIGFADEGAIDDRIHLIEYQLQTESLDLKEEKKLVSEIQDLKRIRPKVSKLRQMQDDLPDKTLVGSSLTESRRAIEEELQRNWKLKLAAVAQLKSLQSTRKEQTGDLSELFDAKNAKSEQISVKIKDRNAIRQELKAKEKEVRDFEMEQRRIRTEKTREAKVARENERKMRERERKAAEFDKQPYFEEMTLIEQMILWCRNLIKPKVTEAKTGPKEAPVAPPEGTEILTKKGERNNEFWVPPTKGKKAGAKRKAGTKPKSNESNSKAIKHNAETFQFFEMFHVDTPITSDDIPQTLEKLEAELANYKALIKEWEVTRDEMKRRALAGELDETPGKDAGPKHKDTKVDVEENWEDKTEAKIMDDKVESHEENEEGEAEVVQDVPETVED